MNKSKCFYQINCPYNLLVHIHLVLWRLVLRSLGMRTFTRYIQLVIVCLNNSLIFLCNTENNILGVAKYRQMKIHCDLKIRYEF